MLKRRMVRTIFPALMICSAQVLFAQGNSPYSRFGLGDVVPNTNIVNRGMGGISAGFSDAFSINFTNPASYSRFQVRQEERTKEVTSGRVLLDAGINIENRTLRTPNQTEKFSSTNALFSYLQVGIPLRKNWGMSFGLRPITRIGYKIEEVGMVTDPSTGDPIDSAVTTYEGSGGSYLANIGTGFAIGDFSFGISGGYLFGQRENERTRSLFNDTVLYNRGKLANNASFGGLYFNAGAQYNIKLTSRTALRLGVSGNLKHTLSGSQDVIRQTFITDQDNGDFRLDSVYENKGQNGDVEYPASYTAGFVVEHINAKMGGWLLGADITRTQWDDFRFYGLKDDVQNNWQFRLGGQFRPDPASNYFSNVAYRAGLSFGPDYINANGDLPTWSATFGMGLPIANWNRLAPGQYTIVNLALEYNKRGNDQNAVKENTFRLSVGLNFSDLWFNKRKYD